MSMNRSLKGASALVRHRNVLTRAERMARMQDEEKWTPGRSIFGLPKVANRKLEVGKVVKDDAAEGADPRSRRCSRCRCQGRSWREGAGRC